LPPVFVSFEESNYLFTEKKKEVKVRVQAGRDGVSGEVTVAGPKGWVAAAAAGSNVFNFSKKGEENTFVFTVESVGGPEQAELHAMAQIGKTGYTYSLMDIQYDHIPRQSVLMHAHAKAARVNVRTDAGEVGYFMGAGDEVPAALEQIGCRVTLLEDKDMTQADLQKFDAVVLGIRAYNTKESLKFHQEKLLAYVENGGTLVVQYNNSFDLALEQPAPYPMKLSRTRVTDENAEVRFRLPEHPVLNTPNKITAADFEGWEQERVLYFPGEWDERFSAPISCNDPGEKPADGALLVAPYGKGYYVYTGLSFFRELPAGVPGAYRLFANLISLSASGRR
jgi:hypothetical protein